MSENVSEPDARIVGLVEQLQATGLTEIRRQTFVDMLVYLDGRSFKGCDFMRCRLKVIVGRFALDSNNFEDCHFDFTDLAAVSKFLDDKVNGRA